MKRSKKGFTLVELLIVIMIIGVLAASMSLVNGKATASAKASTIINNLRTMKSAALLFYADYYMQSSDTDFNNANITNASADYLGTAAANMIGYGFSIPTSGNTPKKWYVYYNLEHADVKNDADINNIKEKLIASAKKLGFLGSSSATSVPTTTFTADHKVVFLQVR